MKTNLHRAIRWTSTSGGPDPHHRQQRLGSRTPMYSRAARSWRSVGIARDSLYLDGDIPEMVIAHDPSDDDVLHLETCLKAKYGL
ncbi:MAG: hypothetical protein ABI551_23755 [Polyangiaceae bacterium]